MTEQLNQVREYIREKRFSEARQTLKIMNHPKKNEWLAKLDKLEADYLVQLPPKQVVVSQSSFGSKALPDIENPKPAENLFVTIARVLAGGLCAFIVVPLLMILIDTQLFHISAFLMDEGSRRVATTAGAFLAASAWIFAFIARLIAGAADIFAGVYYSILFLLVIPIWHYGSFYFVYRLEQNLASPIAPESFTAYWNHLDALPADNVMGIGLGIVLSVFIAYGMGSLSIKELNAKLDKQRDEMYGH